MLARAGGGVRPSAFPFLADRSVNAAIVADGDLAGGGSGFASTAQRVAMLIRGIGAGSRSCADGS
ncbi:hypothetical protein, partial [Frankia sp. AgW1.1]|uniref:hypothetical protein n=1 Tax=Frankia sp. AgW1.1 TaxID=1836971 RepID=UPI001EE3F938